MQHMTPGSVVFSLNGVPVDSNPLRIADRPAPA
jgi:hypothetical protein